MLRESLLVHRTNTHPEFSAGCQSLLIRSKASQVTTSRNRPSRRTRSPCLPFVDWESVSLRATWAFGQVFRQLFELGLSRIHRVRRVTPSPLGPIQLAALEGPKPSQCGRSSLS